MKRLPLFILAAVLALAVEAQAAILAVAIVVEAPATFSHDGIKFRQLKVGGSLLGGDVLRTGEKGRVIVRFMDGSQAALSSNTDVALRRLTAKQDPIKTTLSLFRGTLRALVKKLSARSSFEVETYNTVVAVKGTDLEVGIAEDKDGKKKTVATCFSTDGHGLDVSGLDRKDVVNVGKGQKSENSTGDPEQPAKVRAVELQKALERYKALTFQALPKVEPTAVVTVEGKPGVTVEPTAQTTPSAAEKKAAEEQQAAEDKFNEAARKAEGATQTYLDAVDSGDVKGQQEAADTMNDLRDQAQQFEKQLEKMEEKLEQQIQDSQERAAAEGAAPGGTAANDAALNQALLEELQQLQATVKEIALQSQLQSQSDASQGNLILDKDGFRTTLSTQILRPDALTIQRVAVSQRNDGPNAGRTEFQHVVTFDTVNPSGVLPADWVPVYERALNDPINLAAGGGSPEYWRVKDIQKVFNASGDCVCLQTDLQMPFDTGSGVYVQTRVESYQAIGGTGGVRQAQRTFDLTGAVVNVGVVSDLITISSSSAGNALHLTYASDGSVSGYVGTIFTVDVNLVGSTTALDANTLGNSLYALATADLSPIGSRAVELSFRSPAYPGREVSPLLGKVAFQDAFREGWR